MKLKKKQRELILAMSESAYVSDSMQDVIKKTFPKLFPILLDDGKWYTACEGNIFRFNGVRDNSGDPCGYGISYCGNWYDANDIGWGTEDIREVTHEELERRLIDVAVSKGYNLEQDNFKCVNGIGTTNGGQFYLNQYNHLWTKSSGKGGKCVFAEGKWADIIPTITREDAEELLGKRIVD